MVEHFVYTEGVGSSSLLPPKAFVERHSKDAALVFGVGGFGDLLYIFYSGHLKAHLAQQNLQATVTRSPEQALEIRLQLATRTAGATSE